MPSLAITGTLGSGKSALLGELCEHLRHQDFEVTAYSADEENRRLLEENEEVRSEIASALGKECLDERGRPDRLRLAALVSRNQDARTLLEGIMHPRLASLWKPLAESHRGSKSAFFVAEIPLLYEKELSGSFDSVLVVGCSDPVRKSRLSTNRSISKEQADHWLSIQQSQERKMILADHLVWNDGSRESLTRQLSQLFRYLFPTHE